MLWPLQSTSALGITKIHNNPSFHSTPTVNYRLDCLLGRQQQTPRRTFPVHTHRSRTSSKRRSPRHGHPSGAATTPNDGGDDDDGDAAPAAVESAAAVVSASAVVAGSRQPLSPCRLLAASLSVWGASSGVSVVRLNMRSTEVAAASASVKELIRNMKLMLWLNAHTWQQGAAPHAHTTQKSVHQSCNAIMKKRLLIKRRRVLTMSIPASPGVIPSASRIVASTTAAPTAVMAANMSNRRPILCPRVTTGGNV